MKFLRRLALWLLLTVSLVPVLAYVILLIVGGGFGDKPPLPTAFTEKTRPLYFAHRGATGAYPENSLAAIAAAKRMGFTAVEIDVRTLNDGTLIVFHDKTTERMLGRAGDVSSLTVGKFQHQPLLHQGNPSDQYIPTLAEAVDSAENLLIYLDVKHDGPQSDFALARAIAAFIDKQSLYSRVTVASSRPLFVAYLEYTNPRIVTTLQDVDPDRTPWLDYVPRRFKPDFLASRYASLTPGLHDWLIETGLIHRYITYHASGPALHEALARGVEMLIVDESANSPQIEAANTADTAGSAPNR